MYDMSKNIPKRVHADFARVGDLAEEKCVIFDARNAIGGRFGPHRHHQVVVRPTGNNT